MTLAQLLSALRLARLSKVDMLHLHELSQRVAHDDEIPAKLFAWAGRHVPGFRGTVLTEED